MASAVQSRKKSNQPICATIHPVVELTTVRGTADRLVNSANCVAVKRGFVVRAMKATYGDRAEPDTQRLERDHDRERDDVRLAKPGEPREAQYRHHLHDAEQPQVRG